MIGGEKVLAVITARGGSKGVPGKNILPIRGRPLIQWTIDAARASRYIDRLIISSDDPAIIQVAVDGGCDAPFQRDAILATDEASSVDVLLDAVDRVPGYDVLVLLQPTSPLRIAEDIDGTLELLQSSGAPTSVSVREAAEHPYSTFALDQHGRLKRFVEPPPGASLRRQDLPPAWCVNGAVYAARIAWFARERTLISPQTIAYPMPAERSLDIDTPEDVQRLRSIVGETR
jgi:N-acylneuraminate cytidylyltransferase